MDQEEINSLNQAIGQATILILRQRKIKECFAVRIILNNPEIDLQQAIITSIVIDQANKAMISCEIHPEDLLEWIEPHLKGIVPMDNYIEEVKENLSLILPK